MGRIRSCFISSPAGTDLSYLRNALAMRNIRVLVPDDLNSGANLGEWITRTIGDVDLVIGILTSERRSQWVLFELGQAAALGRQILLLASPKLAMVPSHLKRFLVIHAGPKNRDAIDFALDQLLASPARITVPPTVVSDNRSALGEIDNSILTDLQSAIEANDFRGIERIVVQALRNSGAEIVSEATHRDRGADVAVWSDALQPFVGNPLLIEIKGRLRGPTELRSAAQSLFSDAASRGGSWSLLLYGQYPQSLKHVPKGLPPTVLVCSIKNLIEQLQTRSFPEIVRDLRNRRVHGGVS